MPADHVRVIRVCIVVFFGAQPALSDDSRRCASVLRKLANDLETSFLNRPDLNAWPHTLILQTPAREKRSFHLCEWSGCKRQASCAKIGPRNNALAPEH